MRFLVGGVKLRFICQARVCEAVLPTRGPYTMIRAMILGDELMD